MIKERVLPADLFTVVNKTVINDTDYKILFMLYQPIIGSDAVSLYLTLITYLDKLELISEVWTHHHLMSSLKSRLDLIIEAREKLEAVGLIKTFLKKGSVNQFIYEIYSPLSPMEFFSNPLLDTILYNEIGEMEYEKVKEYYTLPKINLNDYEDITCRFQDVFSVTDMTDFEGALADLKNTTKNKISIMSTINLDEVLSSIPEEILNPRTITLDTKDFLYRMDFVYGFNDDEMIELVKSSCNIKRVLDKEKFKENAKNYYKFEHLGNLPTLALKTQPEYLRKKNLSNNLRDKKIYEYETTTPYDYLYSKHTGTRITSSETAILQYLLVEMNLNPGVVNVIIDYVLQESKNKLVPTYVESVAGLFSRNNIKTVEEAMSLAKEEHKNRVKRESKKQVKKEIKPEWIDKNFEVKEASNEEISKMRDMLSKVVK